MINFITEHKDHRVVSVRGGKRTTVSLLLTSREKKALNRNYFNTFIWRPALQRVGVPDERENRCHALRHFYAGTALHEGETIKAVSEYLGHADPGFTLRTYTPDGWQRRKDEAGHRFSIRQERDGVEDQ